ncbi:1-phosphatidylinositol 3-phosphate 5-kinase-like [Panonychus citri]|uniref:1-phosphatidylinositol 3-phosphate 5-kinase-like n=1 Tax=Panonychus citri TaxID=50023 RepID=UPI002307BA2C|nr:1-phosphatidylinositol 3-phosphate 5-kinase-like [Panonychus citri]
MDLDDNLTVEERNLKIAAQIGQSLLEQNNCLKLHNEDLEAELIAANETITQLRHEISKKNQLIQLYSADLETTETEIDSIDENSCSSSRDNNESNQNNWEILQEQISFLENENHKLRAEATRRTMDIEAEERKEFLLIHDCAKQLIEANLQLINLQEELARRAEDNVNQNEEITNLLSQVVELKKKIRDLSQENEGLYSALDLAHECQNVLSGELLETKEKYNILMSAFQELQEEMKRKTETNLSNWPPPGSYMPFCESLAAELEDSLDSFGYESGLSSLNRINRKEIDESRSHSPDSMLTENGGEFKGKSFKPLTSGSLNQQQRTSNNILGRNFLFSNKLRIVKPMEGSETLSRWKKMANPNLASIFENTSGIQNRIIENIRTDLSNHIATTAGVSATVSVTVTSMSLNNQQKVNYTTCNTNTNNNNRIRLSNNSNNNNGGDGHLQENNYSDDNSNPGKIFDTTLSTYTFTTTSLSLTSQSTLVTPSFGAVQLSTGHIIPISSVYTSTTSYDSSNRYNQKIGNNLTINELLVSLSSSSSTTQSTPSSSLSSSSSPKIISSDELASSSSSNISNYHQPNVTSSTSSISVLFQDLLRNRCSNYVKYLSGALAAIELSSSDIISYRDLTRDQNNVTCSPSSHHKGVINPSNRLSSSSTTTTTSQLSQLPSSSSSPSSNISPKSQSQHGLNYLASDGLNLSSSLSPLCDSCDRGVITKGSTINPASIGVPDKDGTKERYSAIELHRIIYYGKLLPLKTLRKGGLV